MSAGLRMVTHEVSRLADGRRPFGCDRCERVLLVDGEPPSICPLCATGTLSAQSVRERDAPPELIVPFARSRAETRDALAAFCKAAPMRCSELNPDTLIERMVPVFQPCWLVDANAIGTLSMEVGFDYQVESSQEVHSEGLGWRSKKVTRTKIRWEPRVGTVGRQYLNVPSPAVREYDALVKQLGAWDLKTSIKFTPDLLAQVAVRAPELDEQDAWARAEKRLVELISADVARAAAAQHARAPTVQADWSALNWTWLLVPMYTTWYSDSTGERHAIWLHGQTGKPSGPRYASTIKAAIYAAILGSIALGLWLLAGILLLAALAFPPIGVASVILLVLGFPIGLAGLGFPYRAWRHNRTEARMRELQS